MAKHKAICPYCDERPVDHVNLNCCQVCYHWFWTWMKKGPAAFLRRMRQIETLDNRARALSGQIPGINDRKVVPIKRRK